MVRYDQFRKVTGMASEWITASSAKQRAGRAGRSRPGICYRLYSHLRFDRLHEFMDPEIKRLSLEEVVLNVKNLGLQKPVKSFLMSLVDKPRETAIDDAITFLISIDALNDLVRVIVYVHLIEEVSNQCFILFQVLQSLTPLGLKLANLPVHPHLGKLAVLGAIFDCLDPVLSIVALRNDRDPFSVPQKKNRGKFQAVKKSFAGKYCNSKEPCISQLFRLLF